MTGRSRARFLCKTRAARYSDAETAEKEARAMEQKKNLNPEVLTGFRCEHCGFWHIGTRITRLVGKNLPSALKINRRKQGWLA